MKSEFIECSIGDIVQLKQGLAINAKTKHLLKEKGLPLLRITDLLNNSHEQYVDEEKAPKQCIVNYGDLIYTRTGQVGYIFNNRKGVVHNNCFTIEPTVKDLTKDFIYWYFKQTKIQKYAENIASGSVQKDLNHSAFNSIPFKYPICINTQKKIAHILSTLDNKIELNRKMNQTLEAMAQALFKSWFVDFDPVKAKVNCSSDEELETVAKELGISKEILELFPSEFEDSELGMIPKGWSVDVLDSFVEILDSKRVPLSKMEREKRKGNIPYYGATSIMDYVDDYLFDEPLTLMGEDGSVSRDNGTPFMQYIWNKAWINNHAHVLKGKNLLSTEAIYILLLKQNITQFITGAVQPKINQGNLKRIPVINPNNNLYEKYSEFIIPIFAQIRTSSEEIQTLQKTRDTLLPKLLNGEIEV